MEPKIYHEILARDLARALRSGLGIFTESMGYFPPADPEQKVIVSLPELGVSETVESREILVDEETNEATYKGQTVHLFQIKFKADLGENTN